MSKKKRPEPLYRRGQFRLDWDRRRDGSLRSPNLAVFWYDGEHGGERSASTRTADVEEAKAKLDALYLERTTGQAVCPTCLRPWDKHQGYLVTNAIADYLSDAVPGKESESAIRSRLDHVLAYLEAKKLLNTTCEAIDEAWIERFRRWSSKQPIRSSKGKIIRDRALATTEASVAQLSAAINDSHRRRNTRYAAAFKVRQDTNQTPQHRSGLAELAAMFRYCVTPDVAAELKKKHWGRRKEHYTAEELVTIRRRERAALHRFLIISVASLARPDAAYDVSLKAGRRQWNSNAKILALNPAGRRQTKKFRATVPIARQVTPWLDKAPKGFFVGPKSIRKAWGAMARTIGLPSDREAGEKLIRRSMGKLLRDRMRKTDWPEITLFMGHDDFDQTTDIYAPFDPDYLAAAKAEIERIIDEIEKLAPGAFSRSLAGAAGNVIPMRKSANA